VRIKSLKDKFPIDVVFRQFPLHPETPDEGQTLEQLFAGRNLDIPKLQSDMVDRMSAEGLEYGERTMTFNSRLAQELAKWVEGIDPELPIHDELFKAYFVNNSNLADHDVLLEIVERLGLDRDTAQTVITDRTMRSLVDEDWNKSRELAITGVPTFVMGEHILVGAQPLEMLERLVSFQIDTVEE
tara:strand:+ start:305 stop:859 length:555 start_codon:yes stop_codon:yes gene_type:complete